MRKTLAILLVVVGFIIMVVSYFFLAAQWGFPPSSVEYSDPKVSFAATFFILGAVVLFLAAVVYEILPEKWNE